MEEVLAKEGLRSSDYRRSSLRSTHSNVSRLWSTAMLSSPRVSVPLNEVCENFDDDGKDKARFHSLTLSLREKFSFKPEEQGGSSDSSVNEDSPAESDKALSESSTNFLEHTLNPAYWEEQQNRLPLPLMELMENEVLEILTKALNSYKSKIGRSHFMTKELKRYIEGLRKRLNQRLHSMD